jgi:hypothetical protein
MGEYRRIPKPGTVVRIPLSDGSFAYGCMIEGVCMWIYDFVTDMPTAKPQYFLPENWGWPVIPFSLLKEVQDVCRLELTAKQLKPPPMWHRSDRIVNQPDFVPMCNQMYDETLRRVVILTDDEAKNFHKEVRASDERLAPYIMTLRDQMELICVPPADIDHRKPKLRREKPDPNEPVLIEIILPHTDFETRSDLEDILNETLLESDAGLVSGGGSGSEFSDLVVEAEPKDVKRAIGIIRRVLKKENCPDGTQIRELRDPPIEHALYATPRKRK